jgi:hypothetical protein
MSKNKDKDYTKPAFGMFGYDKEKNNWVDDASDSVDEGTRKSNAFEGIIDSVKKIWSNDSKSEIISTPPLIMPTEEALVEPKIEEPKIEEPKIIEEQPKQESLKMSDTEENSIKWKIPKFSESIIVNIYDEKGNFVDYYTISRWITLKPGQTIEVIAK